MSAFLERCIQRIRNDLGDLYSDPVEGIFVSPDDDKATTVHAVIVGPEGTPYHNGFFYFVIQYPVKYPQVPPEVKLMTTGNGKVQFGHHLFQSGHICMSILGTWEGPGWTPVMTTKSVLISIQSMLCPDPYFDEPRFANNKERFNQRNDQFNTRIKYDRIKAAVHDMVHKSLEDNTLMPLVLKQLVIKLFHEKYDYFVKECSDEMTKELTGVIPQVQSTVRQPTGQSRDYKGLLKKLEGLKKKIRMEDNIADSLYDSLKSSYQSSHKG